MKIGIDARILTKHRAGIGRYVFELCRELDALLPEATFFLYSNRDIEVPVDSVRWIVRQDRSMLSRRMPGPVWLATLSGRLIEKDNLDLFWGGISFLPPLSERIKTLLTVYDLTYLVAPDTMNASRVWGYRILFPSVVRRATRIFAISKGTSDRLLMRLQRAADEIVYPAVGYQFRPQGPDQVKRCREKFGISFPYLLAVATWEPRKNLELLIEAFADFQRDPRFNRVRLVLVGGRGWKDDRLAKVVAAAGSDRIISLGFVADDDLPALYSGAEVFVFPSKYEGYGIPVAEARACGTRVLAADIPEIREAGDSAGTRYINPTAASITAALAELLGSANEAPGVLSRAGGWKHEASKMAKVIRDLA